jgi:protein-S-isoprenylcysteine O-methyltransferase Ste14
MGAWLLGAVWVAFMVLQGRAARRAAPTERRAQDRLYPLNLLAVVVGLVLMLTSVGDLGVLGIRVLPDTPGWFWTGFAITVLGLALAVWARQRLGPFWASAIEIKTGHRLIQDGPYRLVRHPIYAGIMLGALGSGIADCDLGGSAGFAVIAASFLAKLRREERFIAENFGDEFQSWRKRTWALIPFVF